MKREERRKGCFGMIPEKRRDKLAVLKKAIRDGAYKVKAEEIAEKILKERLFELALALYTHKYQKCRNN
jgi:anti-sigma28 factor (negative regulator of flagellin synthesis)